MSGRRNSLPIGPGDPETFQREIEEAGFALADATYNYKLLHEAGKTLMARMKLKARRELKVSMAEADAIATASVEHERHYLGELEAEREYIKAKFRVNALDTRIAVIRSLNSNERDLMNKLDLIP